MRCGRNRSGLTQPRIGGNPRCEHRTAGRGDLRMHHTITRSVRLVAAPLLAGVVGAIAPAAASAAQDGPAGPTVPFRVSGSLASVAATSASAAWAVGYSGSLT